MPDLSRPRQATLFVTCIVDQLYPQIGLASAALLERLGVEVHVPRGLTCCGQMAFNAGYRDEARSVAGRTIEVLRGGGDVVLPSGSCTAMIRHLFHELFHGMPHESAAAELAGRTYELTEYLVDVLHGTDVGARFDGTLAYHDACHGLRFLGLGTQARTLLESCRWRGGAAARKQRRVLWFWWLVCSETCCDFRSDARPQGC